MARGIGGDVREGLKALGLYRHQCGLGMGVGSRYSWRPQVGALSILSNPFILQMKKQNPRK